MNIYVNYLREVLAHKWYVFLECCKSGIPWLGIIHDWSKFLPSERKSYARWFYIMGPIDGSAYKRSLKEGFDVAWNHHQKRNKHHWQYWLLTEDDALLNMDGFYVKSLPMPLKYAKEMLADWRGAGRVYGGSNDVYKWYDKRRHGFIKVLHPVTRDWIEDQLGYGKKCQESGS